MLCCDGASKLSSFVLPILLDLLEKKGDIHRITFLIAAYGHYLSADTDDKRVPYEVSEPHLQQESGQVRRGARLHIEKHRHAVVGDQRIVLDVPVRREDQLRYWGEAWRRITEDVAILPLYYVVDSYPVRKGITGMQPKSPLGSAAYQIHLWEAS